MIENGTVTGSSTSNSPRMNRSYGGSGIGVLYDAQSESAGIARLKILGGRVEGAMFVAGFLDVSGDLVVICDSLRASSILIWNTSLLIASRNTALFSVNPSFLGSVDLTVVYGETSASSAVSWFSGLNSSLLHIGDVSLPVVGGWEFCVTRVGDESAQKCFFDEFRKVESLLTSVDGNGFYSIAAQRDELDGFLGLSDGSLVFHVSSSLSSFPNAHFIPAGAGLRHHPLCLLYLVTA
jgi:hypothetical protein